LYYQLWDKLIFPPDYEFSVIYGGPTLPYVPLFMVGCIMGLGYLDIWANANKEVRTGEGDGQRAAGRWEM